MGGVEPVEQPLMSAATLPIVQQHQPVSYTHLEAAVLEGLGIGADDFLSKPFRVAELRARVAAHLRRQSRTPAHRMVRNGVAFDLTARSAAVEGKMLPLTRSEYAICEYPVSYTHLTPQPLALLFHRVYNAPLPSM